MNERHVVALVAVAVLVAGTGCSALSGGQSPPPGLSEDGVTSTAALIEAHTEALRNQSFTVRMTTTIRPVNGEYEVTSNSTQRVDPTGTFRGYVERERRATGDAPKRYDRSPDEIAAWREGSVTYRRTVINGTPTYRRVGLLNSSVKLSDALGRQIVLALDDRTNATVETFSDGDSRRHSVSAGLNDTGYSTNRTIELLVAPNGVIREIRVEQTYQYQSGTRRVTRTIRFLNVGSTTVERPDWYSDAVNAT